jgi:hypothetical protein
VVASYRTGGNVTKKLDVRIKLQWIDQFKKINEKSPPFKQTIPLNPSFILPPPPNILSIFFFSHYGPNMIFE